MEHFYRAIQGWFDWENIYKAAVALVPPGTEARFVELGVWRGKSAAFLTVEAANSLKPITVELVDAWDGRGHPGEYDAHDTSNLYGEFDANMKPVAGKYVVTRGDFAEIAALVPDASIDFIFFDGNTDYEGSVKEIRAWLPKLKPTGWMAGHDIHAPGVRQAVTELVPDFKIDINSWWARGSAGPDEAVILAALNPPLTFNTPPAGTLTDQYMRGKYANSIKPTVMQAPTVVAGALEDQYLRGKYAQR